MSLTRPRGYINPTEMMPGTSDPASAAPRATASHDVAARGAVISEQDTKRIEKIRSHASSHRTAGTVALDV